MKRQLITAADLAGMDKLARVQLATSLPGVKPVCLVGTRGADGRPNLAPFSSVVHLGSNPTLLAMVTRPDSVARHTLANIQATGVWTLNHLHHGIFRQAHQCSARYAEDVSEFSATGLTEERVGDFIAPFVAESRFRIGMELVEIQDIPLNGTKLIIGRVGMVDLPEGCLESNGTVDLERLEMVASTALDSYFGITLLGKLPYAKPNP